MFPAFDVSPGDPVGQEDESLAAVESPLGSLEAWLFLVGP
jgi:hypothetical protein